jgi:uncharacterized membrane protein YuzA (DUF378 family)
MFHRPHPVLDRVTLALILYAAIDLGVKGAFGFDSLTWLFGTWIAAAQCCLGLAGIWQLLRQRW